MKPASRFEMRFRLSVSTPDGKLFANPDGTEIPVTGITRNLSTTGLGIKLGRGAKIQPGEEVAIDLFLWEKADGVGTIPLRARVIWIDEHGFCGMKITHIDEKARLLYSHLVEGYEFLLNCPPVSA